jgi:hypothetical protein
MSRHLPFPSFVSTSETEAYFGAGRPAIHGRRPVRESNNPVLGVTVFGMLKAVSKFV